MGNSDRLDEIKKRASVPHTHGVPKSEQHTLCCPCTPHFRRWGTEDRNDIRWLLAQLEAAQKVVEAARRERENHLNDVGHTCMQGLADALDEYDAKFDGEKR